MKIEVLGLPNRRRWLQMGEPEYLSRTQAEQLEAASRLVKERPGCWHENRAVRSGVELHPHVVAAVPLEPAAGPSDPGAAV